MLPFIQGLVVLLAFKKTTSTTIYWKSTGWNIMSLFPHISSPTDYMHMYFGHSLTFWVKSQLGDAAAPQSGMMGFAVRVPPCLVYEKMSRSSRRSLTLLALSGAVPSAPALPWWGCSSGYTLVSLPCSWGRTVISLDVSTFWSMKVKLSGGLWAGASQLSKAGEFLLSVIRRGHDRLWETVRNQ